MRSASLRASARPRRRTLRVLVLLLVASGLVSACHEEDREPDAPTRPAESLSRDAKLSVVEMLRDDLAAERHPSDGGGRAWLEAIGTPLPAREPATLTVVYEAGPLGIAAGGMLVLQISPFWEWDDPQTVAPDARGYTELSTDAAGVELIPTALGNQMLSIEIAGRALVEGEQVRLVYGAGSLGARVDPYAEREERVWLAVDGDGDGVRKLLPDPPKVDVVAGEATALLLIADSTARPGESLRITAALLDHFGNAGMPWRGRVTLTPVPGLDLPEAIELTPHHHGRRSIEVRALEAGIWRVEGQAVPEDGEAPTWARAESNPIVVRPDVQRVLWADLHGHSQLSDGTGTPEDYYDYARNVASLDVAALTDHDHWGLQFLDAEPALWERIRASALAHHEPGRFVALLGYEWTNWLHGHRHVLYFEDEGEVLSSMDPRYETPAQLWGALAGRPVLTFAHHSAGGPVSTNWLYPPDPVLEPVTEIVSVHGSSEALDSERPIYSAVPGNFVRDVLDQGTRFGFIGSGDSHDGHPGLAHLASPSGGGLAAILAENVARDAVLAALRERAVYATDGLRVWLDVRVDDRRMGSSLPAAAPGGGPQRLWIELAAPVPVERIDIVRGHADPESPPGGVAHSVPGEGNRDLALEFEMPPLVMGEYLYVRVVLDDGSSAWSSPFFAGSAPSPDVAQLGQR